MFEVIFMKYCKIRKDKLEKIYSIEKIENEIAYIRYKNVHVQISKKDIVQCEQTRIKPQIQKNYHIELQNIQVLNEIMLRHLTEPEAIDTLDKYLAQAYTYKLPKVRIIHGRNGTVLKNAVHKYLRCCPFIKEYYISPYEKGSIGVTTAILKYY